MKILVPWALWLWVSDQYYRESVPDILLDFYQKERVYYYCKIHCCGGYNPGQEGPAVFRNPAGAVRERYRKGYRSGFSAQVR